GSAPGHDAHLHAPVRGQALVRGDLRGPWRRPLQADRRRAAHDVDPRQARRARRERADRHAPAGAGAPAPRAERGRAPGGRGREQERVMNRLLGVSLVLSSEVELGPEDRERCRSEMKEALADLRTALERTLSPRPRTTGTTLRAELDRLERGYGDVPVTIEWE